MSANFEDWTPWGHAMTEEQAKQAEELARALDDKRYNLSLTMEETEKPDHGPENRPNRLDSTPSILDRAARTFEQRSKTYGTSTGMTGRILAEMFPDGVGPMTPEEWEVFHIFLLKVTKLGRFVKSGLKHVDSIHDDVVYSAMCESVLKTLEDENAE